MIPILYSGTETRFNSEGIGTLADALSCVVVEERNGAYELEMEYPITGEVATEITVGRLILAKPNEGSDPQPFQIYSVERTLENTMTVNAEHISYRLAGVPISPFEATGIHSAIDGIKSHALTSYAPFTFYTDSTNTSGKFAVKGLKNMRACLGGTKGSLLDTYAHLEFEFDKFEVKILNHRGKESSASIEYGKNLTAIKQEDDVSQTYSGCVAFWENEQKNLFVKSDVQRCDACGIAENIYILDVSQEYDDAPTVSQLNSKATSYLTQNRLDRPKTNIRVSFVPLWQTEEYKDIAPLERVGICDIVTVHYPQLGIDAKAKVIKTEYDCLLDRYRSVELGDAVSSFGDTIKQSIGETVTPSQVGSMLDTAIKDSTDKIVGAKGGNFAIHYDANGCPAETYWMDTADTSTARKVLRANSNGIGGSSTGINGPYTVAMTTDGKINADAITTGTLTAVKLKGNYIDGSTIRFGDRYPVTMQANTDGDGVLIHGTGAVDIKSSHDFLLENTYTNGNVANRLGFGADRMQGADSYTEYKFANYSKSYTEKQKGVSSEMFGQVYDDYGIVHMVARDINPSSRMDAQVNISVDESASKKASVSMVSSNGSKMGGVSAETTATQSVTTVTGDRFDIRCPTNVDGPVAITSRHGVQTWTGSVVQGADKTHSYAVWWDGAKLHIYVDGNDVRQI